MIKITTHTLVKNEDKWLWYCLSAWKPYAHKMIIVDDNSTDGTVDVIKTLLDKKTNFQERNLLTPEEHTECRNDMVAQTGTDWFLILDGDEVWDNKTIEKFLNFLENCSQETVGVVMHTRNCIGDIYHYLPESSGKYNLLGRKGHLTIRAYRKLPGFHWRRGYPLETYVDNLGETINLQENHLRLFDGFYWHMTHLKRSSNDDKVKGWRSKKLELGIKVKSSEEFPEVFILDHPKIVDSPWTKMSTREHILAAALTPIKKAKRTFLSRKNDHTIFKSI